MGKENPTEYKIHNRMLNLDKFTDFVEKLFQVHLK